MKSFKVKFLYAYRGPIYVLPIYIYIYFFFFFFFFFFINFFIQTDMQVSIFQKMCEIFPQQKITRGKIKSHVSSPNK